MAFLTEHNITAIIVMFLMVIVLAIEIQISKINIKIEEKDEDMSRKIEELLKKKINQALRNI
jgi:predicted Holliday junction resolvase-like endonuclease